MNIHISQSQKNKQMYVLEFIKSQPKGPKQSLNKIQMAYPLKPRVDRVQFDDYTFKVLYCSRSQNLFDRGATN